MSTKWDFSTERLDQDKPLTSSWPKELKLQEIQSKEDDLTDDDYDEDDDDYFEYDDDEDEYDEEEDEYDDDYYDEEFYENEVIRSHSFSWWGWGC